VPIPTPGKEERHRGFYSLWRFCRPFSYEHFDDDDDDDHVPILRLAPCREERHRGLHALWRFRRPFSYEHFANALNMHPDGASKLAVLKSFIEKEAQLRALQHLPAVFKWTRMVMKRYNRKLDRAAARAITIGTVIAELPNEHERASWIAAFEEYAQAWNEHLQYVKEYECLRIPAMYQVRKWFVTLKLGDMRMIVWMMMMMMVMMMMMTAPVCEGV
jgi:hypothetical protein